MDGLTTVAVLRPLAGGIVAVGLCTACGVALTAALARRGGGEVGQRVPERARRLAVIVAGLVAAAHRRHQAPA